MFNVVLLNFSHTYKFLSIPKFSNKYTIHCKTFSTTTSLTKIRKYIKKNNNKPNSKNQENFENEIKNNFSGLLDNKYRKIERDRESENFTICKNI